MFGDNIYKWLENALDWGISEEEFWTMTLAELERLLESKKRNLVSQQKEKATYDYVLADLIGRSVSRIYNSTNTMPEISTVYPTLFDSKEIEEQKQAKLDEVSALRFKQFADSFNAKFEKKKEKSKSEEVAKEDE